MADQRMARADLITGALLFVLSVAIFYGAWTMDRLEVRQIHPLSVPGLLPGLLAAALAVCSIVLMLQALRSPRSSGAPELGVGQAVETGAGEGSTRRVVLVGALCLIYALGLVGRMPFWLATAIFVAAFVLLFEWSEAASHRARLSSAAWAIGIGVCTGLGVAYAFSELFLVRLP